MAIDIKESATRKIGPLPVWGWAIAVAGAVIGVRLLRGDSATPSVGVVPGNPDIVGSSYDDTGSETAALSDQLDSLVSDVGGISVFSALQQQLNSALIKRVEVDRSISTKRDQIANIKSLYRTGKISKKQFNNRLDDRQAELKTLQSQKTTTDNLITSIQKQIAGIGT